MNRGALSEGLARLSSEERPWPYIDDASVVRYLLTGKSNGGDSEAYGAALYELGLVPDFELFNEPAKVPQKLMRNRDCVAKITWSAKSERGRVLDLGLMNRGFRNELGTYLTDVGVEDPKQWTRRIVLDRNLWKLAFNRWEFEDGGEEPDSICIHNVKADLPVLDEESAGERLDQLLGQQVLPLGAQGLKKFSVSFQVDPIPNRVNGLAKFVAQVISQTGGPIGLLRSKTVWKSGAQQATISFTKLSKVDWEEGWHFVRLLPQTEEGDLIPIVDELGNPLPWAATDEAAYRKCNESDLFYVLPSDEVDVEPPQRAIPNDGSVAHATMRLQFTAVADGRDPNSIKASSIGWAENRAYAKGRESDHIEVKFPREGTIHIPVPRPLKILEQKILNEPEGPISWWLPINCGIVGASSGESVRWPSTPATQRFLESRRKYFAAIQQVEKQLITQAANLDDLRSLVMEYAARYIDLLQELLHRTSSTDPAESQASLANLRAVLAVDSVLLVITDHRDARKEATLVAPTHPLRALWLSACAMLGNAWINQSVSAKDHIAAARDVLLKQLAPVSFPPILPTESGHLLCAVESINPFWSLYAPTFEDNPRGLLGDVCASLGIPEPAIGGATIDGEYLASRVRRYLLQHPYIQTLVINAFNAGSGSLLADMLLSLQRSDIASHLHFDITLFVPDPEAPGVGEAIGELLSPLASFTVREADAFATPSTSHLYPKLRLAVRASNEFRKNPDAHPAHLSFMFDVFPAEHVSVTRSSIDEACSPVHGLIQDFETQYREEESVVTWSRRPRHGQATPLPGNDELSDLLASLSGAMSSATATVATGQIGVDLRPVVTLALSAEDRALLHQLHEVSDWVLTLDRNLGIEYFDHGGRSQRPDYLIDHSPEGMGLSGHRLVVTSRSVAELEAMIRPVLKAYNLDAEGRHAVAVVDQLRQLSGRMALKLISSSNQRAEALGLALSRMYLEHQGVFANQIVIPLDAHLNLYQALKLHADEAGNEVSFRRTDLALFDLNVAARQITCRLVEVKCYAQVGDVAAYNQLQSNIVGQLAQSEEVLSFHFDPNRQPIDRIDRLAKSRELVELLEFYLNRAERYGIVTFEAAEEARFFLRTIEDGYRLSFTRSALIFDFQHPGTEGAEKDAGVEFHRIGVDLIRQLIEAAAPETESSTGFQLAGSLPDDDPSTPPGIVNAQRKRERAPSVRAVKDAAFMGEDRDRTVSWDDLRSKRTLGVAADELTFSTEKTDTKSTSATTKNESPATALDEKQVDELQPQSSNALASESSHVKGRTQQPGPTNVAYDVVLGVTSPSPQYGLIGDVAGRKVALDLNHTHTISLFGVQGGGKSYTLGSIVEMSAMRIPGLNCIPQPLATVIFHYSQTMDYAPEFTSMVRANNDEKAIAALRDAYGVEPQSLKDVILLVPADKLIERKNEYPELEVQPLKFASSELQTGHWRFLMGAVGNQATYIRQLNRIIKSLRGELSLQALRQGIDESGLSDHLKELARLRLDLAAEYIDDRVRIGSLIRPGSLIIVDLRDEFIEKDEALGLFVVLLQLFADVQHQGSPFNKLVVFDEAHKYVDNQDLVAGLVEVVREMRHKGTSILIASQDPPSVPVPLIELSSQIILHKFNSPAWLKHIQKANAALAGLTPERMSQLKPGEAYIWSSKATDESFSKGAVKVRLRPRVTLHGGSTKTAVSND
jgi:hypothetical protein